MAHIAWCDVSRLILIIPKMKENGKFPEYFLHLRGFSFSPVQVGETRILSRSLWLEDMISHGCLKKCNVFHLRRHQAGIQIRLAFPRGVWARQWFSCLKKGNPFVPVRGWQSLLLMTPGNVQTVAGCFMICSVILAWCCRNLMPKGLGEASQISCCYTHRWQQNEIKINWV